MSNGARIISPERAQLRWEMVDLDSQLPDDHRARVVWAFVQSMDLTELYDRIKARDDVAGRPATDPQVVLAVWLYATMEGIGSAPTDCMMLERIPPRIYPVSNEVLAGGLGRFPLFSNRLL
jgi:hypothetical protein